MMIEAVFNCVHCGEPNYTSVDPTGGSSQEYVEDCQICCQPNKLQIEVDPEKNEAHIEAGAE